MDAAYAIADSNGDDLLDRDEAAGLRTAMRQALFAHLDRNDDGMLSEAEFLTVAPGSDERSSTAASPAAEKPGCPGDSGCSKTNAQACPQAEAGGGTD